MCGVRKKVLLKAPVLGFPEPQCALGAGCSPDTGVEAQTRKMGGEEERRGTDGGPEMDGRQEGGRQRADRWVGYRGWA